MYPTPPPLQRSQSSFAPDIDRVLNPYPNMNPLPIPTTSNPGPQQSHNYQSSYNPTQTLTTSQLQPTWGSSAGTGVGSGVGAERGDGMRASHYQSGYMMVSLQLTSSMCYSCLTRRFL